MATFGGYQARNGPAKASSSSHHSHPGHNNAGGSSLAIDEKLFLVSASQPEAVEAKQVDNYHDQQALLPRHLPLPSSLLNSIIDSSMAFNFGLTDLYQNIDNALCVYPEAPEVVPEENLQPEAQLMAPLMAHGIDITGPQSSPVGYSNLLLHHDATLHGSDLSRSFTPTSSSVTPEAYSDTAAGTGDEEFSFGIQKKNHNKAEKKYRTGIKDSLDLLRDSVPSLRAGASDTSTTNWKMPGTLRPALKLKKATVSCRFGLPNIAGSCH